jgi:hypothetical protein
MLLILKKEIMTKKEHIIQRYNSIVYRYKNQKVKDNKINCYICNKCDHITKTIEIDIGSIPFMFNCEKCDGMGTTTFSKDIAPTQKSTIEWYRPSLKEVLTYKDYKQERILDGGLEHRKINLENQDFFFNY